MKVTTDACVLGAWADAGTGPTRVLDIGTGTGLLALMLAQRNPQAIIDAVELDPDAAQQAVDNVANSPFNSQIAVWSEAIQTFRTDRNYDRIVTNPPFYTNSLRSPNAAVNRALHADDLPTSDLLLAVSRLLAPAGQWTVLLPPPETTRLMEQTEVVGLFAVRQLTLRHRADMPMLRQITHFCRKPNNSLESTDLVIYESGGRTYTEPFRALLQDFYLAF